MCTCGALITKDGEGQPVILLGKTLDFFESSYWHDRYLRYAKMEAVLKDLLNQSLSQTEIVEAMQKVLASHDSGQGGQVGSICIHDQTLPGARASTHMPMTTVTAVIFDILKKRMYYTIAPPCQGKWYVMGTEHGEGLS